MEAVDGSGHNLASLARVRAHARGALYSISESASRLGAASGKLFVIG